MKRTSLRLKADWEKKNAPAPLRTAESTAALELVTHLEDKIRSGNGTHAASGDDAYETAQSLPHLLTTQFRTILVVNYAGRSSPGIPGGGYRTKRRVIFAGDFNCDGTDESVR
jgi:hypothetical protein